MTTTRRPPLPIEVAAARSGHGSWRVFTLTVLMLAVALPGACSTESAFPRDQNWGSPIGRVEAGSDAGTDAEEHVDGPDEAEETAAPVLDAAEAGAEDAAVDLGGSPASGDAATDALDGASDGVVDAGPTATLAPAATARRRGT